MLYMKELVKKLTNLLDLVKALNEAKAPSLPQIPAIKPLALPSIKVSKEPKKIPGPNPDSKKDPKKIAEQIKNGSMSTKTQKVMLKADSGQWYLEDEDMQ